MRTFTAGAESVTESDEIFCVVWSWTSHYRTSEGFDIDMDVEHKLTWIKDETWFYYEVKNPAGRWVSKQVRNDKFRPNNLKQAREMATEFIGGTDG